MITEHRITHRIATAEEVLKTIQGTMQHNFRLIHVSRVPAQHESDGKGMFELEVLINTDKQAQAELGLAHANGK